MKRWLLLFSTVFLFANAFSKATNFFSADHPSIQYTGRIDFSNKALPRFWSPGVYITIKFTGSSCRIIVNDEMLYNKFHNYLEIVIDNRKPYRIQTKSKTDTVDVAKNLGPGAHTLVVCKNTESNIGYLEFAGILCESLLPAKQKPARKIEFVGNSITCGAGMDPSMVPCDKGEWYDQHNAYMSYGPTTARALKAQWHLTSVSGIGLMHSCCNMNVVMPEVFDKVQLRNDSIPWDFDLYQPDVVTVCLGQNDGIQDSTEFCDAYLAFIGKIRIAYPDASIVCLNSPMGDANLTKVMKNYIRSVVAAGKREGDKKLSAFFFSRSYNSGCGGHPNMAEHKIIARELTAYIKRLKNWW